MIGKWFVRIFALVIGLGIGAARANVSENATASASASDRSVQLIRLELNKRFPGARIELTSPVRLLQCELPSEIASINVQAENALGQAEFVALPAENAVNQAPCKGWLSFAAWVQVKTAQRRVMPGEKLNPDSFVTREVNVAAGQAREYRGVLLPVDADLTKLETRQTVLEGQFLMSTAVQRVPDVRRGDAVRVNLISNGLTLSTLGTANEPGYVDGQVRVTASKNKRDLVGKLLAGGVVEVKL